VASGVKSNERKSYSYTTDIISTCVSNYRDAIFQSAYYVLRIKTSCIWTLGSPCLLSVMLRVRISQ